MEKKKIVIIGAGFAGLRLARKLNNHPKYSVTLIDRYNFHQFQPLFYQVATARIEPSSISFPLRKIFQKSKNVSVRLTKVLNINREKNEVETTIGNFSYDYLVVATGCTTNFFGNEKIAENAFPMKSTYEAITIQNRLLTNFESAYSSTPDELEEILNIVVVGGGPTGVELSGSIIELKTHILPKDYPDMDFSKLQVYLLEGSPTLLGPMSKESQQKSQEFLESMGVNVWTNARVTDYDGHVIELTDGRKIKTRNLIWAAGVTGNAPSGIIEQEKMQRGNRIPVDRLNRVLGEKNIFAIGDIAYMETPKYPNGHPQLANVAINQALNLARNFDRFAKGVTPDQMELFEYKDPGSMATVGKNKAVVDLPKLSFQGRIAWFVWMFLHLMLILSVRNKFLIFWNWATAYFTNDTTLRIIYRPTKKDYKMNIKKYRKFILNNETGKVERVEN
ncbi:MULTISPECIES: NAD(P)/FAD-dependent oxidoreductase [Weeksella]|uniref:NADH:ubiquinone reductase (non-electrogenic) n=1 Tax=Weeksella virosa (strain ATCC 43766 / DSM 16922 / JCM 21250 / CCUG 30538 / CDC 9751 / IAM 14551 / NBRC 16016 / NCTC 11634 / CL345/78) TaxID=865938 RepID=F0P1W1_WEEVC|nr:MULTISPECIES: NAD(P)/FAD-dependent oxidoreductase [Weeksella]ADX68758.1 NADH dehydrogenase (ubiquinone) [Weeksella virosa DSM 16922]MDK7374707.1 NAD(P)/FAD-dependent oxidoreductase [Weeksella virosa]MDK7675202.1 NAD(P)/FAD-dependent oxidoreductase [Weeksella virosa]OFM85386.1 NADH dehydrogenase [Weeksella sp. HMSC059D05]SUP55109.1 NADH dehydrogenase-like protein SAV0941 [Weeksella virosa]